MSSAKQYGRCPTCSKRFEWDSQSPWRPFCSERCRLIDLGEWLDEGYKVPDQNPGQPYMPPDDDEGY
ncbi:MAG: DNA gyrase inhibitor YacG [Candidatus Sedimenticola sp. PURPLELP]